MAQFWIPDDRQLGYRFEDLEDLPNPRVLVVMELLGPRWAVTIIGRTPRVGRRVPHFERRGSSLPTHVMLNVVEGWPIDLERICLRWQNELHPLAPFRVGVGAWIAVRHQRIADPHRIAVDHLRAAFQPVVHLRTLRGFHHLTVKPQILIAQHHRPDTGVPPRFDGRRRIRHRLRLPCCAPSRIQRSSNPQILIRIDQRVLAVDQRAHAKIHVAPRGDHARHAARHVVHQAARLDGDGVAIDAAHVGNAARGDAREPAVDQARVVQLLRDIQRGGAIGDNLGACAVGQALTPDGQVTARRNDAGVVQPRPHAQRQVAVGNQATYMRVATSQRQCQVTLGLQPAGARQGVGHHGQAFPGGQRALGVAQLASAQFGLRLRGHEPCGVVQRGGAQIQRGICGQLAAGVVDTVGPHRQRTGQHAQRLRGAAHTRVAVVQRSGAQIQRGVGLQQAAQVGDRAQGRHRKVLGGDDAALVVQGVRRQGGGLARRDRA
ncbi:hypothetical protein BER2_4138 [plant metagenome]|uniref:Uncharacterized protein n=1 Tax=plant metagenome TaxID=1297885 RepID=A0A484R3T9_9ZZZZ